MKNIFLLVIALLLLAACSSTSKVNVTGEWKLVSYGDPSNPTAALPKVDTSIKFENGQLSGNVGCNGFGGNYELKGDKIIFSGVMSTLMFCEETSAQEQGVLTVFSDKVELKIQMTGDTLTITSADGSSAVNLARK